MINVLHLYYDILNLYGENGNVRCINNNLELSNIKCKIDFKSIHDKIDFSKYDIVYIGSGDEEELLLCLDDLKRYKDDIKDYIEKEKCLILTGNSMYMFGKYIDTLEGKIDGLGVFDYYTKYINNPKYKSASNYRVACESISSFYGINELIIGFQNRCGTVMDVKKPLFKTSSRCSNDLDTDGEGFSYKNVYATMNIGPLLIRNPYFLDYILSDVCKKKDLKYKVHKNTSEKIAYHKYLEHFKREN